MTRPSEEDLIARYFAPLALDPGADGLRDDAALIRPPEANSFVITVDTLVEGVHFLPDDPPDTIARKALRVNLSDLAAKGAAPYGFLLSLALPDGWAEDWLAGFAAGLAADVKFYGFPVLGGDTVHTPGPLSLSVTALGTVARSQIPRRRGARPGDQIYVTGSIGDGALGLKLRKIEDAAFRGALTPAMREHLIRRYQVPEPRVDLAGVVLEFARASMDISDGFVGDLGKLLAASRASAIIDLAAIPLSAAARAAIGAVPALFETAITGGDDYEILFTVAADDAGPVEAAAAGRGVPVTRIGVVTGDQAPPRFLDGSGAERAFVRGGFSHF